MSMVTLNARPDAVKNPPTGQPKIQYMSLRGYTPLTTKQLELPKHYQKVIDIQNTIGSGVTNWKLRSWSRLGWIG